jgi:beta-galactosidase
VSERAGVLFGAAYYPEYQRSPNLERDLDLMVEAGFTVIRVGESVWSTWEPEEGRFDLDWLQPTLDAAHARGIGVVLGTPTYAIPMWLQRLYPEIAGETSTGHRRGWGARQEMDFTHAAYRFHAERVIRTMVGRYRDHPAIIGYQVDNEPGPQLLFNEGVFQRFVDRLRHEYGTVERLNEEWGLVYWSHRLSTWADLWRPDGNFQPQYDLAWRRFQADLVTEFIGWQADIVHSIVGPEPFVTTCLSYEQPGVEDADISARLDIASGNAYYEMADSLAHPSAAPRSTGFMGWIVRGAWAVTQLADLMYSSKQAPFLVTETNAGSIGFSSTNQSPYDGQWRQAAWALVGRGARMIEYWHWNTLPYGAETHWGGVLPHSGEPGRTYRELARLGAELGRAGAVFADALPEHDITILWDSDSKFAMGSQAPFSAPGAFIDPDGYRRIVAAFSRGVFDADRQSSILRPQQVLPSRGAGVDVQDLARQHPVLVVAGLLVAGDDDLDLLAEYARAGGHLVLGPRTGSADLEARARTERRPARLAELAGVFTEESTNLDAPVAVTGEQSGSATDLYELLVPEGAEVLARAVHPHLGGYASVTTRAVGAGRITVVGTVPDQALAAALVLSWSPVPVSGWADLPASVTVSTSRTPAARLHIVHNWGWDAASAVAPAALTDLLTGDAVAAGDPIELGAWDVRVLTGPLDEETS